MRDETLEAAAEWAADRFVERTPPRRVDEVEPASRVSWSEIRATFGITGIDARVEFQRLFELALEARGERYLRELKGGSQ